MSTRSTEVIEQITKIYDRVDGDGVVTFLLYIGSIILTLLGLYFLIISTNLDFVNEGNSLGNRGRFVGGTAGSIWAFAGVLLFIIILRSHNKEYQLTRTVLEKQSDHLLSLQQHIQDRGIKERLTDVIEEKTAGKTSIEPRIDAMISILKRYIQQSSIDSNHKISGGQFYQYLKEEFITDNVEFISEKKLKKLRKKYVDFSGFLTLFLIIYQEMKDLIQQEDEDTKVFIKSKLISSLSDSEIALLVSTLPSFVESKEEITELRSLLQTNNIYQMNVQL